MTGSPNVSCPPSHEEDGGSCVRRYLPLPGQPTFVPFAVNPLYDPSKKSGRKFKKNELVPLQSPSSVELFTAYHGLGCVPAIPLRPADASSLPRSSPPPPLGPFGPSAEVPAPLPLSVRVALAGVHDPCDSGAPASSLLAEYMKDGRLVRLPDTEQRRCSAQVLHPPGPVAAGACGDHIVYIVTFAGVLYASELGTTRGENGAFEKVSLRGEPVELIVAGGRTALALTRDKCVYCWGCNRCGQCMRQPETADITQPIRFRTGKISANALACGGAYASLVYEDGVLSTWGAAPMLGAPLTERDLEQSLSKEYPWCRRKLLNLKLKEKVVSVSTGPIHAAAITAEGRVLTWGEGRRGRLGHGSESAEQRPRLVEGIRQAREIRISRVSCGGAHTVALTTEGSVWAWGDNSHGQLGVPFKPKSPFESLPVAVGTFAGGVPVIDVAAGAMHTLLLLAHGDVLIFGALAREGVLDTDDSHYGVPRRVMDCYVTFGFSSGLRHAVAWVLERQIALCLLGGRGCSTFGELPELHNSNIKIGHASAGVGFMVLLLCEDGCIYAIGNGEKGQLGTGKITPHSASSTYDHSWERVRLPTGYSVQTVHCGPDYVLAVTTGGKLLGWGNNDHGQLAMPSRSSTTCLAPELVEAYHHVGEVATAACGATFAVVLLATGAVYGHGEAICLGLPSTGAGVRGPTAVRGLEEGVVQIAAGNTHAVALTREGKLLAWGCGVGTGTPTATVSTPLRVSLPAGFEDERILRVGCGPRNSFAISQRGVLWVWGDNSAGQCGAGSVKGGALLTPTAVAEKVRDAAFYSSGAIVTQEDGTLLCAGESDSAGRRKSFAAPHFTSYDTVPNHFFSSAQRRNSSSDVFLGLRCFSGHDFALLLTERQRPSPEEVCKGINGLRAHLKHPGTV